MLSIRSLFAEPIEIMKIAIAILLSAFCAWAKAEPPKAFEIGQMPQGRSSTNVFEVKNELDTPFEITEVQKACGCTDVDIDEKYRNVPPGATFEIKLTTKAPELLGVEAESFKTLVRILGKSPSQVIEVTIAGTVIPRVLAIDGVPRFKLDSPPASEQMRKTFA